MSKVSNLGVPGSHRGFAVYLAVATAAASVSGFTLWSARHLNVGDPIWWQGGSLAAGLATALFTIAASKARQRVRHETPRAPSPEILALPAPEPTQQEEEPMATASTTTISENFVETERTRLAKAGYTEAEISQILIARETSGQAGSGGVGQGVLTGVLSNLTAVMGHARNFLPSLKADFARILSPRSSFDVRLAAFGSVILKASVVGVLAYVLSLEFVQLKAVVEKTQAEACSARMKMIAETSAAEPMGVC